MENFPSIEPVYATAKDTAPLNAQIALGDGYKKRVSFGLSAIKPEWNIEWLLSAADANSVDLFLENRGADGEWFYWAPPDQSTLLKWRCDEWTLENDSEDFIKVNAFFKQVLELNYIELLPAEATCLDDMLCGTDEGIEVAPGAKFLMIGNPYYSLDITDPTAIAYQPDTDIIGCQTITYTSAGMIVMSGGKLTRSETNTSIDLVAYQEYALYSLDGEFIRRLAYERPFYGTYFYSYEAPYMSVVTADNKILASLLSYEKFEFLIIESDASSGTRISFNNGASTYIQDMKVNPLSGRVYINCFAFNYVELSMLEANRSAGWSYRYTATTGSIYAKSYGIDSGIINGDERIFVVGMVQNTISASGGPLDSRNMLVIIDADGIVINSWRYQNTTIYSEDTANQYQAFYAVQQDSDNSLVIGGVGTIETQLPLYTDSEGATLTRINSLTGDVIKSVGIYFINDFPYSGYNYFSHSTIAIDSDGTIYYTFGAYDDYNYLGVFLMRFNANLENTGCLYIKPMFTDMSMCGLTLTEDKILIPGIVQGGAWGGTYAYGYVPQDGITLILDKAGFESNSIGQYWLTGQTGPANFVIEDISASVRTMILTQIKESLTIVDASLPLESVETSSQITASSKAPASVVLTKQASGP
jgi:phage-related protein